MTRRDIFVNTVFETELTDRNDIRTITGENALVQRAVLLSANISDPWKGSYMSPERIEHYRSELEYMLEHDDVLEELHGGDVSVEVAQSSTDSLSLSAKLGDLETGPIDVFES